MSLDNFIDQTIKNFQTKIQSNNLNRDDLEDIFNCLFQANRLLFVFDNSKLQIIKSNKRNFYLFFVAFIKNYLNEINQYISNLDISDQYTDELSEEIDKQNNAISSFVNDKQIVVDKNKEEFVTKKAEAKNNSKILNEIETLLNKLENNQLDDSEKTIVEKFKKNQEKLLEKENQVKSLIDQLINSRNEYLKYKTILENRFEDNKQIIEAIGNIKEEMNEDIIFIEEKLKSLENKINKVIQINQKLNDQLLKNPYPRF